MEELGYTCSVKAVSQHLQKLKKKDSGSAGTGHVTSGGKVGKASTPKKAATPMKRGARKGKQADVDLLTDDSESPLESKASCKVKKEHRMKEEPDSDDDKKGAFGDMGRGGGNAGALAQGQYLRCQRLHYISKVWGTERLRENMETPSEPRHAA
ncbi:hypothetical protein P8C59_006945 [Phyllachora maydis]|uniref:Uncharacterized protein n=1 Tax=Phyllachora maydis TaxID=1825666 RepID=A0AAD9MDQ2_9PEZI|nr:hypothetical protein P8C59_006945 [Phyllachora maydis]